MGGRAQAPRQVAKPQGYKANGPNQVYSWDITYLAAAIRGAFYRLYMVEDIFSRKIVGWEVHEDEQCAHASVLIRKTCLARRICEDVLVLHSDSRTTLPSRCQAAVPCRLGRALFGDRVLAPIFAGRTRDPAAESAREMCGGSGTIALVG